MSMTKKPQRLQLNIILDEETRDLTDWLVVAVSRSHGLRATKTVLILMGLRELEKKYLPPVGGDKGQSQGPSSASTGVTP
jgi:hypothetical protein